MKKILLPGMILLILLFGCGDQREFNGVFSYQPENPEPGEEITVRYSADSTVLSKSESITMRAYLYGKDLDRSVDVDLVKKEDGWFGNFKTDDSTRGVVIKFSDAGNSDNNNKEGYVIHLFKEGKPVPGTYAGYAEAFNSWGYYADIERNDEKSLELLKRYFEANPELKKEYASTYLSVLSREDEEKSAPIFAKEKSELESDSSEESMIALVNWYKSKNDSVNSEKYYTMLAEKYPHNRVTEQKRYREFSNEKNLETKKILAAQFEKDFPDGEYLTNIYELMANYYRDNKMFDKAKEYLEKNKDKVSVYRFYSIADNMIENKADLNTALEIAKMGVEKGKQEYNSPTKKQPNYLGESGWKEDRGYELALNLYTEGKILHLMGKDSEAIPLLAEATKLSKEQEVDINNFYAKLLVENGEYEKAKGAIENFLKKGKSSQAMRDYLKTAYLRTNGTEEEYNKYIAAFDKEAEQNLSEKLKQEMINTPAPGFKLTDLAGKEVSLDDFKGKTVIIDFWATWCGPCLHSFPGMKEAVEKFSNNENVKFLFINSWERVDNKKENAQQFLNKTKYPFHVLMDTENKVIADYKVSGIPTKFIIDKNGNIRFKSIGYDGNSGGMVEELSAMIAMIN